MGFFQYKRISHPSEKLVSDLITILFSLREKLREKKLFVLSDEIRARMLELGLIIEDTAEGTKWKLG